MSKWLVLYATIQPALTADCGASLSLHGPSHVLGAAHDGYLAGHDSFTACGRRWHEDGAHLNEA